ncbi:MAG: hypothetical protein ACK4K0_07425 [Flavobacteriales bacterium]
MRLFLFTLVIVLAGCVSNETSLQEESTNQHDCLISLIESLEPISEIQYSLIEQNRPGIGIFESDTCGYQLRVRLQFDQNIITACEWNIKHDSAEELNKLHSQITRAYNHKTQNDKPVSEYEVWIYLINNKRFEVSLINNLPDDASISLYIWPR